MTTDRPPCNMMRISIVGSEGAGTTGERREHPGHSFAIHLMAARAAVGADGFPSRGECELSAISA